MNAHVKKCFACFCCGFLTCSEEPPGAYEICPVCFWEDVPVQFRDPDFNDMEFSVFPVYEIPPEKMLEEEARRNPRYGDVDVRVLTGTLFCEGSKKE